jgi:hypothetical protein
MHKRSVVLRSGRSLSKPGLLLLVYDRPSLGRELQLFVKPPTLLTFRSSGFPTANPLVPLQFARRAEALSKRPPTSRLIVPAVIGIRNVKRVSRSSGVPVNVPVSARNFGRNMKPTTHPFLIPPKEGLIEFFKRFGCNGLAFENTIFGLR